MKILVGIDQAYEPTLNLLARLGFNSPEVLLIHSIRSTAVGPAYDIGQECYAYEGFSLMQDAAEQLLCQARTDAKERGLHSDMMVLIGDPAVALLDQAEKYEPELIAVGSERKSTLGSLFLGSTTRGLTNHAKESVLVCKGQVAREGPLRAVFATDHSPYAERAFERFLAWQPQGISLVHVVSAAHTGATKDEASAVEKQIADERMRLNASWVTRLAAAGYVATSSLSTEEPNSAIRQAMREQEGDLLIVGAQGHGFLHRMMLGSVALHQVAVEDYPVLIVRA